MEDARSVSKAPFLTGLLRRDDAPSFSRTGHRPKLPLGFPRHRLCEGTLFGPPPTRLPCSRTLPPENCPGTNSVDCRFDEIQSRLDLKAPSLFGATDPGAIAVPMAPLQPFKMTLMSAATT